MAATYYGDQEFDHFYRYNHRTNAPSAYYERSPYRYNHDQGRYDLRSDYHDHDCAANQTLIGEADQGHTDQQHRRRIAIACGRCRRRKIKCSGDPGDGTGCAACRSATTNGKLDCSFNRVGSNEVTWPTSNLTYTTIGAGSQSTSYPQITTNGRSSSHHSLHRSSLPILHTLSTYPPELDSDYNPSPIDAYAYSASMPPRQDSINTVYGLENYRSWPNASAPISATTTTTAGYEPHSGFAYAALPATSGIYSQQGVNRLPNVTSDSVSALNMGHLNASLPAQTVHQRRLPIPYVAPQEPSASSYSMTEVPEIRPLEIYSSGASRLQTGNYQGRTSLPWVIDSSVGRPSSSNGMMTFVSLSNDVPVTSTSYPQQNLREFPESTMAYNQYGLINTSSTSLETSPTTTVPNSSEGCSTYSTPSASAQTTSMLPPANTRYMRADSLAMTSASSGERPTSSRSAMMSSSLYPYHSFNRIDAGPYSSVYQSDTRESGEDSGYHNTYAFAPSEHSNHSYNSHTAASTESSSFASTTASNHRTALSASPALHPSHSYNSNDDRGTSDAYVPSSRHHERASNSDRVSYHESRSKHLRHPQPQQHAASISALCRQSSFDEPGSPRSAPTQEQRQERGGRRKN